MPVPNSDSQQVFQSDVGLLKRIFGSGFEENSHLEYENSKDYFQHVSIDCEDEWRVKYSMKANV